MISLKTSPYLLVACCVFTFVVIFSLSSDKSAGRWSMPRTSSAAANLKKPNYIGASDSLLPRDTTSEIGRASNSSLGFERVFVLGLEERTDKRDAFALAAALTGFNVEFVEGVRGDDVLDVAKPPGMTLKGGAMGCWRGHMNIIRKVVQEKIASVIIFEDDADWDIRLARQMPDLAKGVRSLSGHSLSERQHSPYGDDWDIIWPGHCGEIMHKDDDRKYLIENDETVAPKDKQPSIKVGKDFPEGTRIVHRAGAPICTFGYAISYRGAQKILMALGVKGRGPIAIDNAMAWACADRLMDLQCYSIEPQLMQHHRPAGSVNKDSDIRAGAAGTSTEVRKKGITETIVLSTRLNLQQLIMGTDDYEKQW